MVIFIGFLTILSLLDRNVISLFLDEIRSDLAISEVQASLIYGGAFALTFSLMGLPMGWAVDRISRRRIIFAGVASGAALINEHFSVRSDAIGQSLAIFISGALLLAVLFYAFARRGFLATDKAR